MTQIFKYISLLQGRNAKSPNLIRNRRTFRPIATMLSLLLLTGGPVHAGPVAISDVIQVLGSYQNPPELRLRSLTPSTPISGVKESTVSSSVKQFGAIVSAGNTSDSLFAGVAVNSNDPQRGVEIIDQGEVDGTICDCGDILVAAGGFPKWPLLFLAAIPFFFIDGSDDIDTPTFTSVPPFTPPLIPEPNPPEIPIPEPASLLLLGTGLAAFGAGLRRRYAMAKLATQVGATKEAQ